MKALKSLGLAVFLAACAYGSSLVMAWFYAAVRASDRSGDYSLMATVSGFWIWAGWIAFLAITVVLAIATVVAPIAMSCSTEKDNVPNETTA